MYRKTFVFQIRDNRKELKNDPESVNLDALNTKRMELVEVVYDTIIVMLIKTTWHNQVKQEMWNKTWS